MDNQYVPELRNDPRPPKQRAINASIGGQMALANRTAGVQEATAPWEFSPGGIGRRLATKGTSALFAGIGPALGRVTLRNKPSVVTRSTGELLESLEQVSPALFRKINRLLDKVGLDMPVTAKPLDPSILGFHYGTRSVDEGKEARRLFKGGDIPENFPNSVFLGSGVPPTSHPADLPLYTLGHEFGHARHNLEAIVEPERHRGRIVVDSWGIPRVIDKRLANYALNRSEKHIAKHAHENVISGAGRPEAELIADLVGRKSLGVPLRPGKSLFSPTVNPSAVSDLGPRYRIRQFPDVGNKFFVIDTGVPPHQGIIKGPIADRDEAVDFIRRLGRERLFNYSTDIENEVTRNMIKNLGGQR